eukprot:g4964.t1
MADNTPEDEASMMKAMLRCVNGTCSSSQTAWSEMGLTACERERRQKEMYDVVCEAAKAWLSRQQKELMDMQERLLKETAETSDLRHCLFPDAAGAEGEAAPPAAPPAGATDLTSRLRALEPELTELRAEMEARLARFNALKTRIFDCCARMGVEVGGEFQEVGRNVSLAREGAFKQQVTALETELANRRRAMCTALDEVRALNDELEMGAATGSASDVDSAAAAAADSAEREALGLTDDAIARVSARASALQEERTSREERLKSLGVEIRALWDRLDVAGSAREAFFAQTTGLGLAAVRACEVELGRLQAIKREKVGELLAAAREKIAALWDTLQYGEGARAAFTPAAAAASDDAEAAEKLLDVHEAEIATLEAKVAKVLPLLKRIEQREDIVRERDEMEAREAEKARELAARKAGKAAGKAAPKTPSKAAAGRGAAGGSKPFQQRKLEEQMRKRIDTLPKRTKKLREQLEAWAEENGPLLVKGVEYLQHMNESERAYLAKKHEEKLERQRRKKEELQQSKTYHSPQRKRASKTPLKRGAGAARKTSTVSGARTPSRLAMTATENNMCDA